MPQLSIPNEGRNADNSCGTVSVCDLANTGSANAVGQIEYEAFEGKNSIDGTRERKGTRSERVQGR